MKVPVLARDVRPGMGSVEFSSGNIVIYFVLSVVDTLSRVKRPMVAVTFLTASNDGTRVNTFNYYHDSIFFDIEEEIL